MGKDLKGKELGVGIVQQADGFMTFTDHTAGKIKTFQIRNRQWIGFLIFLFFFTKMKRVLVWKQLVQ